MYGASLESEVFNLDSLVNFICPSGQFDLRTLVGFFVFVLVLNLIFSIAKGLGGMSKW